MIGTPKLRSFTHHRLAAGSETVLAVIEPVGASSRACSASRPSVLVASLNADDLLALERLICRYVKRTGATGCVIGFPNHRILYQIFRRVIA